MAVAEQSALDVAHGSSADPLASTPDVDFVVETPVHPLKPPPILETLLQNLQVDPVIDLIWLAGHDAGCRLVDQPALVNCC